MSGSKFVLSGVKPYDGEYEFDGDQEFTTIEWGWIKRNSGYLPLTIDEGFRGLDPELLCTLAVISMYRAGKIEKREAPSAYERISEAPFPSRLSFIAGEDDEPEEADAGPPDETPPANEQSG